MALYFVAVSRSTGGCTVSLIFMFQGQQINKIEYNILRKTIEGYLDSVQSLTPNIIKTELNVHAFHNSIYLQSK